MSRADINALNQQLVAQTSHVAASDLELDLPWLLTSDNYSAGLQAIGEEIQQILADLGLDQDSIEAGLLYPWYTAHAAFAQLIQQSAEPDVANILNGVEELTRFDWLVDDPDSLAELENSSRTTTQSSTTQPSTTQPSTAQPPLAKDQGENLRRLVLAMINDPRVLLIRLAWHLYRLRHVDQLPYELAQQVANRCQVLFAPLANRLGIWQLKWQLEDLALRELQPEAYRSIAKQLAEKRSDREAYLNNFLTTLTDLLKLQTDVVEIKGRAKHIYSIWRKMHLKHKSFNQLSDTLATRIIVENLAGCYAALGAVHNEWTPVPGEFDDYIAKPKANGYQSLHTAVYGHDGRIIEVQIRTLAMHEFAELGIAAHWNYKESGRSTASTETDLNKKINWLRQLLEIKDDDELEARLRDEVFEDRVYVFTPSGDIIDLVHDATPLDLAYHIHTDLGHRCRGAKINGRITPLTYRLHNGDRVEILTSNKPQPSRDWLHPERGYLASSRARGKVRHWFRQQDRDTHLELGEDIVQRELRLSRTDLTADALLDGMAPQTTEELYAAVGRGDISNAQIQGAIQRLTQPDSQDIPAIKPVPPTRAASNKINVLGDSGMLNYRAKCCNPVPPEPIIGFITKTRGVAIHRQGCHNIERLQTVAAERLIEADWSGEEQRYTSTLKIKAWDRPGLLRDITNVLTSHAANVSSTQSHTDKHGNAYIDLTLTVSDLAQLEQIIVALQSLPNVITAERV